MSGGGLPLGAEYERRAPWNEEPTEPELCTYCGGTGVIYWIMETRTKELKRVSKSDFNGCAEDEDDAEESGRPYCKYEVERCEQCGGLGYREIKRRQKQPYDKDKTGYRSGITLNKKH